MSIAKFTKGKLTGLDMNTARQPFHTSVDIH